MEREGGERGTQEMMSSVFKSGENLGIQPEKRKRNCFAVRTDRLSINLIPNPPSSFFEPVFQVSSLKDSERWKLCPAMFNLAVRTASI